MFRDCDKLQSLDLSNFDTSNVYNMDSMFYSCHNLQSLDLSNFDTSIVANMDSMFTYCNNLNYIKCKSSFRNWCWKNQDTISLPPAMREGGSGTWDIIV